MGENIKRRSALIDLHCDYPRIEKKRIFYDEIFFKSTLCKERQNNHYGPPVS